jgi:hypothetical protein
MIVLDADDNWQVVLQPHHGDLAGQLAQAWGNETFATPRARASMVTAATRHDDGWTVRERAPDVAADGRPMSFLETDIPSHLGFYRAAVTDVTQRDAYAGLMVAMHAAGLYCMRYDTHPQMGTLPGAEDHEEAIQGFLDEIEGSYPRRREESGLDENEQWTNYRLLQVFDRLSLYFSGFFKLSLGDVHTIAPVPVDYEGNETELRVRAVSAFEPFSPLHVTLDPYPFGSRPAVFTLERRVLRKGARTADDLRAELERMPTETVEIRAEPA